MQKKFNDSGAQWRSEEKKLELLVGYYHQGQPRMLDDWRKLSYAVTDYVVCAKGWNAEWSEKADFPTAEQIEDACGKERGRLDTSVAGLNSTQETNRRYAWKGWNSPEELHRALEGKTEEPSH
jgi:hypothetical protein